MGFKGITKKYKNEKYSSEFKINIINYMKHNKTSYSETSFHFGISESSIIACWKKEYENHGVEAFNNPQGRPINPMKKDKREKIKKILTREEELEVENKMLKIENAYIKKCIAYGIAAWGAKKNSSQK